MSTSDGYRFRRPVDWFVVGVDRGLHMIRLHATAERAVELFHRLSASLDPVVDVVIDHQRDATVWEGPMRFLPDVREAIGRLRWPLAAYGGVEISLATPTEQITLMPSLDVFVHARATQWLARIANEGLVQLSAAPPIVWRMPKHLSAAPELTDALTAAAERLELERRS